MNSMIKVLSIVCLTAIAFTACSTKNSETQFPEQNVYLDNELDGAPSWLRSPKLDDKIVEVGSAQGNIANDFSFQREEAVANARNNIARRIDIQVNNMFKTFKNSAGFGENMTFDKVIESVSKQISSESLKNSVVEDMWISKSKTMYVLVSIGKSDIKKNIVAVSKSSFKNEDAQYQKMLAEDSETKLDMIIENLEKNREK